MINFNDVAFAYKKGAPLFESLTLDLEPGKIYGLLGRNGAGKSTLLKLMGGMLFPHKGQILAQGHQAEKRLPETLSEFFLIPEEFDLPVLTIKRYAKVYGAFYPRFEGAMFEGLIHDFELEMDKKLNALSYGQKKKFLISFGLATQVKWLIMDEPTNGLDIPSKSQFRKIVASCINSERSFLISTHQVRDLESLIDPVIILEKGHILLNNSLEEITNQLVFKSGQAMGDEVIFSEEVLGKQKVVARNREGAFSDVDLELLFNAVIKHPSLFTELFN